MLTEKIESDLKSAQLARDEVRVSTLRILLSEIHNLEILLRQSSLRGGSSDVTRTDSVEPGQDPSTSSGQGKGGELSDDDIISVIQREVKKRKEAAEGFRSGGRQEQVQKEETEAKILESYLPAQLSNEELTEMVGGAIKEVGATSVSDMGKVMGAVMGKVSGRADGGRVSELVKEQLGG